MTIFMPGQVEKTSSVAFPYLFMKKLAKFGNVENNDANQMNILSYLYSLDSFCVCTGESLTQNPSCVQSQIRNNSINKKNPQSGNTNSALKQDATCLLHSIKVDKITSIVDFDLFGS